MRNLILMAIIVLAPAALAADFGIRAGQYRDADQKFIGAEMLFDTGALNINPNIEYSLEDDITAGSANLDVTLDIGRFSTITPYVGAGLGLIYVDTDIGGDTTDLVGNLIGGVAFELGSLKPYAQVKYFRTLEDDDSDSDDFAMTIGLRF
jgi:opacity protein-like surface antigen